MKLISVWINDAELPVTSAFGVPKAVRAAQPVRPEKLDASGVIDSAFMQSVVDRWRQTTTAGPRPKAGLVSLEQAVTAVVGLSPKLQARKMD